MECGLPVICYNRGGQVDFLRNNETGYLIDLGNKDSFFNNLLSLLNSSEKKEKIKFYNKELVKEYYISNVAKQYLSIFDEVLINK